ncbi:HNH/endonuclease VII fold putative polymorphic toxin [Orbus wheelerorum]|uniref:VENN motif pre-toxin domain-containing protein n=1 Tax=Orbus wheelerorum TaxID=3074111 RepID=UPI00370D79DE
MGSAVSKGIDAATAIVSGLITGDFTGGLAGASAPYLAEQIKLATGSKDPITGEWKNENPEANLIAHAILGAAVAAAQGNSALAGGIGAVSGEAAADYIRKTLYDGRDPSDLTQAEKENISALAQLASGLAVAAGSGGNIGDVGTAVAGSKNAVENNSLAKPIIKGLEKGYEFCMKNATCRNGLAQLGVNFGLTNSQIQEAMDAGRSRDPEQIKGLMPEQVAWLDQQILAKKGLAPIMFGSDTWGDKIYHESLDNELKTTIAIDPNDSPKLEGTPIPEQTKPIIIGTPIQEQDKDEGKFVTPIIDRDKNEGIYAGPEISVGNWQDNVLTADGLPPPNMSPEGAGRSGAFNEAKRQSGIPVTTQPDRVVDNYDRQGKKQEGRVYEFDVRHEDGTIEVIKIREDAGGHIYGENNPQNRGPHFNDDKGNHYDY